VSLLTKLTKQLAAVEDQLKAGDKPDPTLLQQLGQTADALAALIAVPAPQPQATPPAINPNTLLDPLASIDGKSNKPKADPLAGLAGTPDQQAAPQFNDQVAQFLASLGLAPAPDPDAAPATSAATTDSTVSAATSTAPLPAIAQLAAKLAELSSTVAPIAPEVAKQLQALTQKLRGAEADPQVLAALTSGTVTDGTGIDQIVRTLLDAKPAAPPPTIGTPQIAAPAKLDIPAPIAPAAPQTPTVAPVTLAPTKPDTGTATVKPSAGPKASVSDDTPKPEAKIVAAAAAKIDTQPDKPDNSTPATAASVAPAATTAARAIPAAYQAAANPINMAQVAFEMVRQAHQGTSRFTIRIDPPELGRVDVRMHVDAAGNVNARLTVDRLDTLDMFQRDRGSLEKALSQAGLDSGKTNLEFSLRQNPFAGMSGGNQRSSASPQQPRFSFAAPSGSDTTTALPSVTLYRGIASAGGVNLFV
jgi:flagellar hook-length control protein FliK